MKVTFNETQYEFKTFYSETNGHEIHLFRNDKILNIVPIWGEDLPNPNIVFNMYINILKPYIEFDSVKVHFK